MGLPGFGGGSPWVYPGLGRGTMGLPGLGGGYPWVYQGRHGGTQGLEGGGYPWVCQGLGGGYHWVYPGLGQGTTGLPGLRGTPSSVLREMVATVAALPSVQQGLELGLVPPQGSHVPGGPRPPRDLVLELPPLLAVLLHGQAL